MTPRIRLISIVLLLGLGLGASGCQQLIAFFAMVSPPKEESAEFEFDEDDVLLVFVDDRGAFYETPIKSELTRRLTKELRDKGINQTLIPFSDLSDLASTTPGFALMPPKDVAKKLGADKAIYVEIKLFQLRDHPRSPVWKGRLETEVSVIDAKEGKIWPREILEGRSPKPAQVPAQESFSPTLGEKLTRAMAAEMATKIAMFFVRHPGRPHDALPEKDPLEEF